MRFDRRQVVAAVLVAALAVAGLFEEARGKEKSGFLGDYSQLTKGLPGRATFTYTNASVNFAQYNKILMDPIQVWAQPGGPLSKVPKEEMQALLNYFDAAIREELRTYKFVDRPEADTMVLRVALSEGRGSKLVPNLLSSIVPQAQTIEKLQSFTPGTYGFSGDAESEMELVDAVSHDRLAATVDLQTGGSTKFETWPEVKAAMDARVKQLAKRLDDLRGLGANPDVK